MKPVRLTNQLVLKEAGKLGFDLVGFARAETLNSEVARLEEWLNDGYQAGMKYMERNSSKRRNIREILPDAESVITLGVNYYSPDNYSGDKNMGKISRYAWGKDYHLVIWDKLENLCLSLQKSDPDFRFRYYVDTGPVMDKAWAVRGGIGWLGKHTNVINREIGSWFFIANVITNKKFDYNEPIEDFCGSCTACLDACPTSAIVQPYVVDSNKCISYLTIENKNDIPDTFSDKFDNWIFGCDICQDVCPWNEKFSKVTPDKNFHPVEGNKELDINEINSWDNKTFTTRFSESPVSRTKLRGLKRNADFLRRSQRGKGFES